MCEANAYMVKDGKEELLMESVDLIEPEDNNSGYRIMSIFGEQKMATAIKRDSVLATKANNFSSI